MEDFQAFNLQPQILQAVQELGYTTPTPIQEQAIPLLMDGRDVLGQARTGTGKTAAFTLPMINGLDSDVKGVQGLIVAPTRELALQVSKAVQQYGRHLGVRVLAVYGGQPYSRQISQLQRGVDVVVGTPGRMLDLIRKGLLKLQSVRYLVLDEADEMLSMGFIEDIEMILSETPDTRQTSLFSATMPRPIQRLSDKYMNNPEAVIVTSKRLTVDKTEQRYYLVKTSDKLAALNRLLEIEKVTRVLVFTRTKVKSAELANDLMSRGVPAEALHGDLSQSAREMAMGRFRRGRVMVLVATDVAARGLDIDDISHVINYDIPFDPEAYVHRIGRTGRAGREGIAITLLAPGEQRRLRQIENYIKQPVVRAKLPSVADVLDHRDARFLDKLRMEMDLVEDKSRKLVWQLNEEGFAPAEIAAALIQISRLEEKNRPIDEVREVRANSVKPKRGGRHDSRDSRRKPARRGGQRESGMVRFSIDVGKDQGIRPRDVVGAIAGEAGIPGRAIGAIDIQNERILVDVSEKHADRVQSKMAHCRMRGHSVSVQRLDS